MHFAGSERMQRSFASLRMTTRCRWAVHLANPRQLLAAEHVDDAIAADPALQHDQASRRLFNFADGDRAPRHRNFS